MNDNPKIISLSKLLEIIKALRTPVTGCPWDLEQDHKSLRPYMIEEAFEAVEAIDLEDDAAMCDELGDVLLQVVLHAQIAEERGAFDISDIARNINDKMVRRHPHVFSDGSAKDSKQVLENWEAIKLEERGGRLKNQNALPLTESLESIPKNLPALLRAQRIGDKASKTGFDWPETEGAIEKMREEVIELEEELSKAERCKEAISDEIGDVLFSLVQISRKLDISAEDALRESTQKFTKRFKHMEENSTVELGELEIADWIQLWASAKQNT